MFCACPSSVAECLCLWRPDYVLGMIWSQRWQQLAGVTPPGLGVVMAQNKAAKRRVMGCSGVWGAHLGHLREDEEAG